MGIPKLKRIKVSSEQALRTWLARNSGRGQEGMRAGVQGVTQDVMIVTCNRKSRDKHISSAQVREVLGEFGWVAGPCYTLDGNLLGHVGRHP